MACRCPVVSTEVGGPRDIVQPGLNGYLVRPGDADALARRLVDVLTLPDPAWRAMSEHALATARRYSWDGSVAHFEAALLGRKV
jgi:glycosyltransferase involved in cell wall biosynthesis